MLSTSKKTPWLAALVCSTLFLNACDRLSKNTSGGHGSHGAHGGHGGHGHGSEEEGKTAVITVWGERFEAFIEHDFLVINQPTKFITHISDLVTFKPRTEGSITFVMQFGKDSPIRQKVDEVARAGIYLPMIKFPKIGTWKVHIEVPLDGKTYLLKLPDTTVFEDDQAVKNAPDPLEIEGVSYLKEQQWKIGTSANLVTKRTLSERLRVSAVVAAPLKSRAYVTAPISGELLAPESGSIPSVGTTVQAGQVLARIRPTISLADHIQIAGQRLDVESTKLQMTTANTQLKTLVADLDIRLAQAESQKEQAEIAKKFATQKMARDESLFKQNAKSKRELEESRFKLNKALSEVKVAENLINRLREVQGKLSQLKVTNTAGSLQVKTHIPVFELKAPISGVISKRHGVVGEFLKASNPVFSILDPKEVVLKVKVPETQIHRLGKSREAFFQRPGENRVFHPVLKEGGRFLHSGLEVEGLSRVIPLIYKCPNKDKKLRIGMTLTVFLETHRSDDVIAAPDTAIVEEDGQAIAFVHISGETYEKRELTLGIRSGNWVEIKSGLNLNDRVVTKGAYNIRLASLSTALPAHGHAH